MANAGKSGEGKLVTVFGGSGFVGRYVVRELAERGYSVRVAVRRPDLAGHLQPLGGVGQIQAVQANLRYRWSVDRVVAGADHVINLVAILHKSGKQTFDAVQDFGARAVAEAIRAANGKQASLVHVSAIGANADSASEYAETKAAGEKAVLETLPSATIIRPSIVFGQEDQFFNRFAGMARSLPILPIIGSSTQFQPVHVADLAEGIVEAMEANASAGKTYEIGGPEVKTFRELMEQMMDVIDVHRPIMNIPFPLAKLQGRVLGLLPNPLLTTDQVELLRSDNVVSETAISAGRTLSDLGVTPRSLATALPNYLYVYRDKGQFAGNVNA